MIRVGVTGTVGAGKSTVGQMFEEWGAWRIDADELAREAVEPGSPALAKIRQVWGDEVIGRDGALDREALRERVFSNPADRKRLERIVHPEVRRLQRARLTEAGAAGADIVVSEVPLLYEVGLQDEFDVVVVVDASPDVRRRRVQEERGVDAEAFRAMEAAQWPGSEKREAADYVLLNDGSLRELEEGAREVWEEIRARAGVAEA